MTSRSELFEHPSYIDNIKLPDMCLLQETSVASGSINETDQPDSKDDVTNQDPAEDQGKHTGQNQSTDSFREDTETLQKRLRFYFYHSIKYQHDHHGRRCSVQIFYFFLMMLQITKIICITILMYQFGRERGYFNNIVTGGQLTMRNLLLKGWSAAWETPPYPPSRGEFAVYDSKSLQDKINNAVKNFYSLMEDSIGFYQPLRQDSVPLEIKYMNLSKESVEGLYIETKKFKVHVKNHTDPATNETIYVYDVLDDLKQNNFTGPIRVLLSLTLSFSTESVRVFTDEADALCLIIHGKIIFADPEKNGQMKVKLETETKRIRCKELGYDVSDQTEYLVADQMAIAVLTFSSLSLACTVFCFGFGLYVCWQTFKYMKTYCIRYFENERYEESPSPGPSEEPNDNTVVRSRRDLPYTEYMKFFRFWDIMVIVADCVMIPGCNLLLKESKSDAAWTVASLEYSSVLLGCGCLIGWFALLRYFKFNYKFHILFNTIYASIWDVLAYLFCVTVLFLGYLFFGYAVFGPYHIKFETLQTSAAALVSLINGDEIYATFALIETDQTGGGDLVPTVFSIYLGSFIAIFTIIVLNLLIALFTNAYDSIKKHYENQDSEEDGPLQAALKELLLSEDNKDKQVQKAFLDLMKKDQSELSSKYDRFKTQMERTVLLSKSKDKFVSVKPKTIKEFMNDDQDHKSCIELLSLCCHKEEKLSCSYCFLELPGEVNKKSDS